MSEIWFFFWIVIILGLTAATTFVAMREKKARAKAIKSLAPQPLDDAMVDPSMDAIDDGFGAAADDFSELDENAFK